MFVPVNDVDVPVNERTRNGSSDGVYGCTIGRLYTKMIQLDEVTDSQKVIEEPIMTSAKTSISLPHNCRNAARVSRTKKQLNYS